ncbi:MAG TPA: zinc-dependent alcohol dehydrogenase [Bryobacteraceae bacterium]|nr:zinc-dependent alcohol dehydrogenase [Bryobacteraceae bacterium]
MSYPQHCPAAILTARGSVTVQPVPLAEPGTGEVLMRMEACGLCHSDLFVSQLEKLPLLPLTLGHEGIGRIVALGAGVEGWVAGDRAGITFLASTCGACELCASGNERFCPRQLNFGYTVHGALSVYAVVPAPMLVRVSDRLSAAAAAPLCCAGWTAFGALREAGLRPGQSVALWGMGGLGHLAIQYARHLGLRVAAADVSESKLEMARALGADLALPADTAGRTLQKQWGGADAAIILTGSPVAVLQAFRSLKRTGTLITCGLSTNQYELPMVDTVLKGLSVRGSYLGTRADLEEVFRLAESGVGRAHVECHALEETPELLEKMRRGEILGRAVIVF